MKLEKTRELLRRVLAENNPILLLSGGIDSILTLFLAREIADVPTLAFTQDFNFEQMRGIKKLIFDFNLTCYTFPPMNRYFAPNGEETSLVDEYNFGGVCVPVIRDFEQSNECGLELNTERSGGIWLGWNAVLTGSRKFDRHSLTDRLVKTDTLAVENLTFYAPLFEWTKQEVRECAEKFGLLKYEVAPDTGNLQKCGRCLSANKEVFCPADNKMIPTVQWNREAMRNAFRGKYGYGD